MSFILSFLFMAFLIGLGFLLFAAMMGLTAWYKVTRPMRKARAQADRIRREARRKEGFRQVRRRLIPREYGIDVEYELMPRTGQEQFVIVAEVLAYRGEKQVSDVKYVIIHESVAAGD